MLCTGALDSWDITCHVDTCDADMLMRVMHVDMLIRVMCHVDMLIRVMLIC